MLVVNHLTHHTHLGTEIQLEQAVEEMVFCNDGPFAEDELDSIATATTIVHN